MRLMTHNRSRRRTKVNLNQTLANGSHPCFTVHILSGLLIHPLLQLLLLDSPPLCPHRPSPGPLLPSHLFLTTTRPPLFLLFLPPPPPSPPLHHHLLLLFLLHL